jgi:hypothetical protein
MALRDESLLMLDKRGAVMEAARRIPPNNINRLLESSGAAFNAETGNFLLDSIPVHLPGREHGSAAAEADRGN